MTKSRGVAAKSATDNAPVGFVRGDELYRLAEVKRRLGLGDSAIRQARRKGLRVRRMGSAGFILGADLLRFVEDL